jgi:N-acetyl sugar amidotransferase
MKYCSRCLNTDTRPNTVFTPEGLCAVCHYAGKLESVDWTERFEILTELVKEYRPAMPSLFDCIIGVSGGKDSTRQALFIRDKLHMRPLLVCMGYPPDQVTRRGVTNLSNLIELGFDTIVLNPAPETWRGLKQAGFDRYTNSFRSTELALFSTVPRLAIKYRIPLIFWGENAALQVGDLASLGRTGYDGNNLRNVNTLSGGGLHWMLEAGFPPGQLISYRYPAPEEFEAANIQIVYLGWFLGDWSLMNNAMYGCTEGIDIRRDGPEKTGDWGHVTALDEEFTPVNQMIKYYKYGFGRATDYMNEEIRLGRISRDDAIRIVERYDGCCGAEYIKEYCDYLRITVEQFWEHVHRSVNRELFTLSANGTITPRFRVGVGL